MKVIAYIILLASLSFVGCKEEKTELIDLTDIIAESDRYKEGIQIEQTDDPLDSLKSIRDDFARNGIEVESVIVHTHKYLPDRFGTSGSFKYQLVTKKDTLLYLKWSFKDSMKVMNAFFNWIDCFGPNCKSIYVGEEKNFQTNSMQLFVNDTSLIFIESKNNVDFKLWIEYHKSIGHNQDWNYLIEQRRHGRGKWFVFDNDVKTPLKNEDSQ